MTADERFENLEKGLASARRFNRWLLVAVGLALGVWLLVAVGLALGVWILAGTFGPTMAAAPAGGGAVPEIRSNKFVLVDENGKTHAVLGVTPIGSGLVLYDEAGMSRAVLQISKIPGDPSLVLFDTAGKPRATLHVVSTGPGVGSGLILYDEAGKNRAALAVYGGWPGVRLFGADDVTIWKAP